MRALCQNFQVTLIFLHSDWSRFTVSEVIVTSQRLWLFAFLYSNEFEENFVKFS